MSTSSLSIAQQLQNLENEYTPKLRVIIDFSNNLNDELAKFNRFYQNVEKLIEKYRALMTICLFRSELLLDYRDVWSAVKSLVKTLINFTTTIGINIVLLQITLM